MLKNTSSRWRSGVAMSCALAMFACNPKGPPTLGPPTFQSEVSRPVYLVLSVGGQDALAHLGTIRAIQNNTDLAIRGVAGSSMGSLVGSLYATHPSADPVDRYKGLMGRYEEATKDRAGQNALLFGILGFVTGGAALALGGVALGAGTVDKIDLDRFVAVLDTYYKHANIEDLPIPYANFHQRIEETGITPVAVTTGNLATSVGASVANPLIFERLDIRRQKAIDPGADRILRTPIQDTCELAPASRILAINITGEKALYQRDLPCPVLEIEIPPLRIAAEAMLPNTEAFKRVVEYGEQETLKALHSAGLAVKDDFPTVFAKSFIYRGLRIDITQTEKWTGGIYPDTSYRVAVLVSGIPTVLKEGELSGEIEKAWVTDLDKDGRFEAILLERVFGTGSIGNLLVFEWTGAELLPHSLPPLNPELEQRSAGHDSYEVNENTITRELSLLNDGDPNCCPTGGTAEVIYVFHDDKLTVAKSIVQIE